MANIVAEITVWLGRRATCRAGSGSRLSALLSTLPTGGTPRGGTAAASCAQVVWSCFPGFLRGLGLFVVIAATIAGALSPLAWGQEPGFEWLFDGKTLQGWEGSETMFRVADGAIVAGSLSERIAHNEFLATKEEFGDFELRLKARLRGEGKNAGVQFRSQRVPDHFEMIGYQCDIGSMRGQSIWGALYDESRRRKFLAEPDQDKLQAAVKDDDFNDLVIRCEGSRIQIWVNGVQTVDYTEPDADLPRRGRLGLQIHGGPPAEAAYKEIRIRRL
jgi:hypothetical protein